MKKMIVSLILCGLFSLGFSILASPKDCSKYPLMPWAFDCEMLDEHGCSASSFPICCCGYEWIPNTCDVRLYNCLGEVVTEVTCGIIIP